MVKNVGAQTKTLLVGYILEDGRQPGQSKKSRVASQKGIKRMDEAELDDLIAKSICFLLSVY